MSETTTDTAETNPVADLVAAAISGSATATADAFNAAITSKISDIVDARKDEVAANFLVGPEDTDDSNEDSEVDASEDEDDSSDEDSAEDSEDISEEEGPEDTEDDEKFVPVDPDLETEESDEEPKDSEKEEPV